MTMRIATIGCTTRVLAAACILLASPAARAAGLYCALSDPAAKRAYVSEVRRVGRETRLQTRNLASRFRRTVNVEYSTYFVSNSGVCHRFGSPAAAAFNLGRLKETFQNNNIVVVVVGSY